MAIITTVTFDKEVERIQKFLANNYADIANNITDNEILIYWFGAAGEVIEHDANQKYVLEGIYPSQDSFITTYSFPASAFTYDWDLGNYTITLPFPPVNLPLGYSIKSPMFVGMGAQSFPLLPIMAYQRGYDSQLPFPDYGGSYWVEGDQFTIQAPNVDLLTSGWTLRIPMLSPRSKTGSGSDIIQLPDGAREMIFDMAIERLVNRKNRPQNNVNSGVDRYTEKP
jgi:hypothetical protein